MIEETPTDFNVWKDGEIVASLDTRQEAEDFISRGYKLADEDTFDYKGFLDSLKG